MAGDCSGCHVFCLDNSECAALSEDYVPTRLCFQREAVSRHLKGCMSQIRTSLPTKSIAVLRCGGRPQVTSPATSDYQSTLAALTEVPSAGPMQLVASLKLALLLCKRFSRSVVSCFVASKVSLTCEEAEELAKAFATANASLDIVLLGQDNTVEFVETCGHLVSCIRRTQRAAQAETTDIAPAFLAYAPPNPVLTPRQQFEPVLDVLCGGTVNLQGSFMHKDTSTTTTTTSVQPGLSSSSSMKVHSTGPLARMGRVLQASACRYESLDSLQHLSADGFIRSWLPSYSNIAQLALSDIVSGGPGYCYISVYKLNSPKAQKNIEIRAGRVFVEVERPLMHPSIAAPDAYCFKSSQASIASPLRLVPDKRKGHISLVLYLDNSLRLAWTEASDDVDCPQYASIFNGDGPSGKPKPAEVEVSLCPIRTKFSAVPDGRDQILELQCLSRGTGSSTHYFFWLQHPWVHPTDGTSGATALARHLQAMVDSPGSFMCPTTSKLKPGGTPVQLGPLPLSLVEDIMRANGKELLPTSSLFSAAASHSLSHSRLGGAAAVPGRPVASSSTAHVTPHHGRPFRCSSCPSTSSRDPPDLFMDSFPVGPVLHAPRACERGDGPAAGPYHPSHYSSLAQVNDVRPPCSHDMCHHMAAQQLFYSERVAGHLGENFNSEAAGMQAHRDAASTSLPEAGSANTSLVANTDNATVDESLLFELD